MDDRGLYNLIEKKIVIAYRLTDMSISLCSPSPSNSLFKVPRKVSLKTILGKGQIQKEVQQIILLFL